MSTVEDNPVQRVFINCNETSTLEKDEVLIQIKEPAAFDVEEYNVPCDIDKSCVDVDSTWIVKKESESNTNEDFFLNETKYRPLLDEINHSNNNTLPNGVDDNIMIKEFKVEPIMDTEPTTLVPITDSTIRNLYMPRDVDKSCVDIDSAWIVKKESESNTDENFFLDETKYRPLLDEVNHSNSNTLPNEVNDIITIKEFKLEPDMDTVPTTLVPYNNPAIRNSCMQIEVKDSTGLKINKVPMLINLTNPIEASCSSETKFRAIKPKPEINKDDEEFSIGPGTQPVDVVDTMLETLRTICTICQKNFDNMVQLDEHIRSTHKNRFRCNECRYTFVSKDDLETHLKSHEMNTYMQCPLCPKKYRRAYAMRAHHVREHSTVEPKSMHEGKDEDESPSNSNPGNRKGERSVKVGQSKMRSYTCQICDKVYSHVSHLRAHRRIAHGVHSVGLNIFECKECNKKYSTEAYFRKHVCPNTSILCSLCGKALVNKNSLQLHMRVHTGERPYQCNLCPKSFSRSVPLRVHKLTHKGVRPYACDLCDRTFTQRSTMMAHRRTHPGHHPPPPPVSLGCLLSDED